MAEIAPFRAIRFNPSKVSLSLAICPPYDVISVLDYERLVRRSPHNIVRVELPLKQGQADRYVRAGDFWEKWQRRRVLIRDREPAFYGYEQRFQIGNKVGYRRGFFAALRLEKPGRRHVRPHERTFPKPKEDRLRLLRATQANISPIFTIFLSGRRKILSLLGGRMKAKPFQVARDMAGVTHRLWRWTDPALIKTLASALRGGDVFIADGHHRYETAWNYAQERSRRHRSARRGEAGYQYILAYLCPLEDPGLRIQPTHRLVQLEGEPVDWSKRIRPHFMMHASGNVPELVSRLRLTRNPGVMAAAISGRGIFWLTPKGNPRRPVLPVVRLHQNILDGIPANHITYHQDPYEMIESVRRGESAAAFLLPPPDKEAFARACRAGRLLPQKSTYFYPKVGTGLVMRTLRGDL